MDELISKQALKEDLLKRGFYPVIVKCALQDAPVVDAVEVVRCKECFRRYSDMCPMRFFDYEDGEYFDFTKNDYFCSLGERKRDEY